ncbi:MAG: hypothetical protein K2H29_03450 [Oscillospiraceae bacterium]|nr:hypothetical protein [Oscillospiraceae bacterium]MDE5884117.1 hypothetical protein [Oscillospiraceae bacterium]
MKTTVMDYPALIVVAFACILSILKHGLTGLAGGLPIFGVVFLIIWLTRITFDPENNEITYGTILGRKQITAYDIVAVRLYSRRKGGSLVFELRSGKKFYAWKRCKNMQEFLQFLADRGVLEG